LLNEGWQVVFVGRRVDALKAAMAQAGPAAARATALPCDVSREGDVAALFDAVRQRFGRLDLLFNNAGISLPAHTPDKLQAEAWRQAVDINLNGAFFCLS
jgi:NAD(P)-dependent dehydrogenase (short-subunit alcohol dehydrogenase family)